MYATCVRFACVLRLLRVLVCDAYLIRVHHLKWCGVKRAVADTQGYIQLICALRGMLFACYSTLRD